MKKCAKRILHAFFADREIGKEWQNRKKLGIYAEKNML